VLLSNWHPSQDGVLFDTVPKGYGETLWRRELRKKHFTMKGSPTEIPEADQAFRSAFSKGFFVIGVFVLMSFNRKMDSVHIIQPKLKGK
jgi:hypothetical protein